VLVGQASGENVGKEKAAVAVAVGIGRCLSLLCTREK
jgi:hypothetical protein